MSNHQVSAGIIIRQRRSAVAFDGRTSVSRDTFYRMLSRVMPRAERSVTQRPMPFDAIEVDTGDLRLTLPARSIVVVEVE